MLVFIEDYINNQIEDEGSTPKELASKLNITTAMVSQYRLKRGYKASLAVAKCLYKEDKIALHPFSAESLEYEIEKDNK